ncbi:hypothetical protein KOI35_43960 [Actinoplanes bogorensis]|uniref:Uncharacterized protein n=1 Tax=Paractinoplanes bogorensis TaxID=1610840 RepID=A0ABS5Z461_9ACTN|nr:hypothetical protein [Actinoplanes bogorensis]MBU2670479.1 hypothetical protein [Actinoplanes bogorensis]
MSHAQVEGGREPVKKSPGWPYAVLLVAVLVLVGGVWTAYDRGLIVEDSGVTACEAMRGGSTTFKTDPDDGKPMTEDEYRRARQVFADSRHDDIRDHGTQVMDIVWRISQMKDDEAGALLYAQPLATQVLGLESACADQGVFLPIESPESTGAPVRKSAGTPVACAAVFKAGQVIAKGFDGACANAGGKVQLVPVFGCKDGRKLFQIDSSTGAKSGWGYAGAKFKATDPTADPAYSTAVQKCLG